MITVSGYLQNVFVQTAVDLGLGKLSGLMREILEHRIYFSCLRLILCVVM